MDKDKVKKDKKKLMLIISDDAVANAYDTSDEHISRWTDEKILILIPL